MNHWTKVYITKLYFLDIFLKMLLLTFIVCF